MLALSDEKQDTRPKCDWPITSVPPSHPGEPAITKPCGSEDRIYRVSKRSKDYWGAPSVEERNVCQKHLGDAWNETGVDSAVPLDVSSGKA